MPAVELARLKMQIEQLSQAFPNAEMFMTRLRALLYQFGNHAYHAGQEAQLQPLLPTYHVAPLVMRQLEMSLSGIFQANPQQAMDTLQMMWEEDLYEARLLAAHLLGILPPATMGDAIVDKLRRWGKPDVNIRLAQMLFEKAGARLRREKPGLLLRLAQEMTEQRDPSAQAAGMRVLLSLTDDPSFENLPAIFRLASPLMRSIPPIAQTDLNALLTALIRRSAVETSFFLRQALSISTDPSTGRAVRRCLPQFPSEQQEALRQALRVTSEG